MPVELKDLHFEILEKIIALEDSFYNNLDFTLMHQSPQLRTFTTDFQNSIAFIYKNIELMEKFIISDDNNSNSSDSSSSSVSSIATEKLNIDYDQLSKLSNERNKK